MITTDELKVQLAEYHTAVKDLEEALAIDASRKRVQELEHTMSRPGFYDDAELSKKVFDEVGDLKGKLTRFEKLQGLYDDAETMLVMLDEEYDPEMVPEAEEAVNAVGKAVDELQLMTMLNGEYDHSNAILTFHAGTGGTEAQDWAEMLYRMYNKWAQAHGMTVEVLDYQDGDEAGMKSASMMVKGANAYGLLKSENGVHRLVRVSPFDANARRQTSFASLEVMPGQHHSGGHPPRGYRDAGVPLLRCRRPAHQQDLFRCPSDPQAHRRRGQLPDPAQPVPEP
jgi:peptide chain release factor 2